VGQSAAHDRIVAAIEQVLQDERARTPDLGGRARTSDVTSAVLARL
jgi:tartrate dehydrogenase/decarboxylase/D-malate dehydrogenase